MASAGRSLRTCMTNEEIARRGFEAVLSGDLDAVKEFLDPDVKWHGGDPQASGACRNRQEALRFMARAGQNRRIGELVDVKAAGDKVAVIIRPRASKGQAPGLVANLTTFRDGKAVEMVHYARADDALLRAR
jgi:ketosteroid isomerase-like protein